MEGDSVIQPKEPYPFKQDVIISRLLAKDKKTAEVFASSPLEGLPNTPNIASKQLVAIGKDQENKYVYVEPALIKRVLGLNDAELQKVSKETSEDNRIKELERQILSRELVSNMKLGKTLAVFALFDEVKVHGHDLKALLKALPGRDHPKAEKLLEEYTQRASAGGLEPFVRGIIRRCVEAIKEEDADALRTHLKRGAKIDFTLAQYALEELKSDPNFAKYSKWVRPVICSLAIKYGDREALYSALYEIHREHGDVEAALDDAMSHVKEKDPKEREKQKIFAKETHAILQLSEAIYQKDAPFIEGRLRYETKVKADPTKQIKEALLYHPELGDADEQFVLRLCAPLDAVQKKLSAALQKDADAFLSVLSEYESRQDLDELASNAQRLHPSQVEVYLKASLRHAITQNNSDRLITLFFEARKRGFNPVELCADFAATNKDLLRPAFLFDAISQQDSKALQIVLKDIPEPAKAQDLARKAILQHYVAVPELTSQWLENLQESKTAISSELQQALVSAVNAKDSVAASKLIRSFQEQGGNPRLLYVPLQKECAELDMLWQEIEIAVQETAIAAGDFESIHYSLAVLESNTRGLDAKSLFKEALARVVARGDASWPTNKNIAFMQQVLASMEQLAPLIQQKEREGKRLNILQLFKISAFAQALLEKAGPKAKAAVYSKTETGLARALQLDFEKGEFYIKSKKASKLQAEGTSKSVTAAPGVQKLLLTRPLRTVRSVNKRDGMISPAELKYLQKYSRQHVRSVASYVSVKPGKPRVEKTSIIMDEFECDLCALSESDASRKIQLTSIADITRQIATTVQSMHAEGDIHRDLKGKNILYRVDPESGLEEVVVADFGLTYHAKTDTQQKECYGTANFTSPERLKGIKPTTEEERLQQGIADDMFAMGCLLFELLHRKRIPWGSDIREYYMKSNAKAKVRGLERYEKTLDALKIEVEKSADLKEKMLLQCCLQLLNPNPKERWQTTPLLNALGAGPA